MRPCTQGTTQDPATHGALVVVARCQPARNASVAATLQSGVPRCASAAPGWQHRGRMSMQRLNPSWGESLSSRFAFRRSSCLRHNRARWPSPVYTAQLITHPMPQHSTTRARGPNDGDPGVQQAERERDLPSREGGSLHPLQRSPARTPLAPSPTQAAPTPQADDVKGRVLAPPPPPPLAS